VLENNTLISKPDFSQEVWFDVKTAEKHTPTIGEAFNDTIYTKTAPDSSIKFPLFDNGQWINDETKQAEYDKKIHNDDIYKKLQKIDIKSIRAIREQNQEFIDLYEQQAISLRSQLIF
jgi:hypothetical protein